MRIIHGFLYIYIRFDLISLNFYATRNSPWTFIRHVIIYNVYIYIYIIRKQIENCRNLIFSEHSSFIIYSFCIALLLFHRFLYGNRYCTLIYLLRHLEVFTLVCIEIHLYARTRILCRRENNHLNILRKYIILWRV